MSTIAIARARRAAEVALAHVVCSEHRPYLARYGDAVLCENCDAELRPETDGLAHLDLALANGAISQDDYDETLDALLGHP